MDSAENGHDTTLVDNSDSGRLDIPNYTGHGYIGRNYIDGRLDIPITI